MRELTSLTDGSQAKRFSAFLFAESIPCTVENEDEDWIIWIHNDDDRLRSEELLSEFLNDPENERYTRAERKVRNVLQEADRLRTQNQKRSQKLKRRWQGSWWDCFPATYIMTAICVLVVAVCTDWNQGNQGGGFGPAFCTNTELKAIPPRVPAEYLYILDEEGDAAAENEFARIIAGMLTDREFLARRNLILNQQNGELAQRIREPDFLPRRIYLLGLIDTLNREKNLDKLNRNYRRVLTNRGLLREQGVLTYVEERVINARSQFAGLCSTLGRGQVWRLISPIFMHLSLLHIGLNMMAFMSFGKGVEYVRGTRRFLLLCLVLAVTSNLVQLLWVDHRFGGMSGVLFGLLGYVYMKGRCEPRDGLALPQKTLTYAALWLILCTTGALGAIANAAHFGGLVVGLLIGARKQIRKSLPFGRNSA